MINLPDPDLQIVFSKRLLEARKAFLQPAVLAAIGDSDITALDEEVHAFVPSDGLRRVAKHGLRAELVFAVPSILQRNPRLLGYYRLLLGFSRKAFYRKETGLSAFDKVEDTGNLNDTQEKLLPDLCRELNKRAAFLIAHVVDLSAEHVDDLSLLTFGPQLRGERNVGLGATAVQEVFAAIREIIGPHATKVSDRLIEFKDATGRIVKVRFGSDPDITVASVSRSTITEDPLLAIEVKGGTDVSNAHNRLGEAEKSHLKAKANGYTDLWTITNVAGLSDGIRRRESPTTTAFYDLRDIMGRQGEAYEDFREKLLQKLRLPASS